MDDEDEATFLTYYIRSLGERTRDEKGGTKFGFDWIIYNLALVDDWIPYRLPFIRGASDETSKTKTEAEFGIDLGFLSPDRRTLRVFVLKDEPLKNKSWTKNDFDTDLRNASAPPLDDPELGGVKTVELILAYNKDEDRTGIEHYERRVKSFGPTVGNGIELKCERWNLSRIVDEVRRSLLTPALLPQKFFSHFSYICAQVGDFIHGSDEWTNQLVPNWRRFLESLLAENADERCIRLVPVALMILRQHAKRNTSAETAWIDLVEWGMLAAWEVARTTEKEIIKDAVHDMWIDLYLADVERFYAEHAADLAILHSLDRPLSGTLVDAVASAMVAHWHVARLGILAVSFANMLRSGTKEEEIARDECLNTVANWLVGIMGANPSALRPVLDIQHIELVLTSATLRLAGRFKDHAKWLLTLLNCLTMRRIGNGQIPFIEGRNRLEYVFEYLGSGKKPPEYCDSSSLYLICLMELICSHQPRERDPLLSSVYRRLVRGLTDCGKQADGIKPVNLMFWLPPADWHLRILTQTLSNEGECIHVHLERLGGDQLTEGPDLFDAIQECVNETRAKRRFIHPNGVPFEVLLLACLKLCTPLPPEFWRNGVFPDSKPEPVKSGLWRQGNGRKYHTEECAHLAARRKQISSEDVERLGLEPCKICKP